MLRTVYVTHFSNCVIWVAESSGFKLRHTLIRQLPYFCTGYQNILCVQRLPLRLLPSFS